MLRRGLALCFLVVISSLCHSQVNHKDEAVSTLLHLANDSRQQSGTGALQLDDSLSRAAQQHSQIMAAHHQLSHQFSGEPDLMQRLAADSSVHLDEVAENVGEADSAESVHQGFMHSPPHRKNLLNLSYNSIGIGVVRRGSVLYVTEDFAHTLPSYSSEHALELISKQLNRIRDSRHLPRLQSRGTASLQNEACAMAHSNSLNAGSAKASNARYVLRFTSLQPENLPSAADKPLTDRTLRSFAVGICFARSASYPSGTYWVVLKLY